MVSPTIFSKQIPLWHKTWRPFWVKEQNGDIWNGEADNNRFILFSVPVTDMDPAALPSLLSPQFSHRSPIVLPFQKENWGKTEVYGRKKEWLKDRSKGTWVQVGEDLRKIACVEKGMTEMAAPLFVVHWRWKAGVPEGGLRWIALKGHNEYRPMALPWVCKPRSARTKAKIVFTSQSGKYESMRNVLSQYFDNV